MKVRHEGKLKMKQFENKASEMLNGNLIIWIGGASTDGVLRNGYRES